MKSARITAPNAPLSVSESETPKPEGDQVLVKVGSVGVCHSDLHYGKVAMILVMVNS